MSAKLGESRDVSADVESIRVEESRYSSPGVPPFDPFPTENPHLSVGISRGLSPALTAGSVGDVQLWYLPGQDTSEYNTEYEDAESQGPDIRTEDESIHNSVIQ